MERVRLLTYEVSWFRASWKTSKSCIHSTAKLWSMMSVCTNNNSREFSQQQHKIKHESLNSREEVSAPCSWRRWRAAWSCREYWGRETSAETEIMSEESRSLSRDTQCSFWPLWVMQLNIIKHFRSRTDVLIEYLKMSLKLFYVKDINVHSRHTK